MNKLIILSGVPGSGKSYFSKSLKKLKQEHVYIVSSDELRKEITGSPANLNSEDLMWKIFYSLAKTFSMDPDGIVILDATHATHKLRIDRTKRLKKLFDQLILVTWKLDKDTIFYQNKHREYPIPEEALQQFLMIYEPPTDKDYVFFDKVLVIDSHDITDVLEEVDK